MARRRFADVGKVDRRHGDLSEAWFTQPLRVPTPGHSEKR